MNTTSILITTDSEVKKKAEKAAKALGISLNTLINRYLTHVANIQTTHTSEALTPTPYLQKILRKAKKNRVEGKGSPIFDNAKDAIEYLHQQIK